MSKRTSRLINIYDVSGGVIKGIPIRPPDYTQRRKKKKNSKESGESNNKTNDKSTLPLNKSDPNSHVINLLPDPQENDPLDDPFSVSFSEIEEYEPSLLDNYSFK